MIRFYRSASIAPGKFTSALAFARDVAGFVKSKTGVEVNIGMPIGGGKPNRIGWSAQFQSLAAYEEMSTKLLADPKYMEMVEKAADNFMPDSIHDELWRLL